MTEVINQTTSTEVAVMIDTSALVWSVKSKGGDVLVKKAHCATAQAFAPKAARLEAGQARDLELLLNGRFHSVLRSVAALMSDKEKLKVYDSGLAVNHAAPSKTDMVPFADHVGRMWIGAKGVKGAMGVVLRKYADEVTGSIKSE